MNHNQWDKLWVNATLATMQEGINPYGLIPSGAIAVKSGKIAWIGAMDALDRPAEELADEVHDVEGCCITPGLIDCHTHLVYAGNRSHEFELRLHGATYEEMARAGGGIWSTVLATRLASEDELLQQSLKRAQDFLFEGVTTIEIKSGYGLDLETELKILRVAKQIEAILPVTIITTFLGAHTIPPEYQGRSDDYVNLVCEEMIPAVASLKLASAVDVFCERIAFTSLQTQRIFAAAKKYDLAVKCHAEQLSQTGAAKLAAECQALSVDHLEYLSEEDVQVIAKAGTVAVLLPGAYYYLRETRMPPVGLLRQHRVPMAIATDCNPGTSPTTSLLLMLNMACILFRLTPEEALAGVTRHAAKALGKEQLYGTLSPGKIADFVCWDVDHPAELAYNIGKNSCIEVVKNGVIISE